MRLCMFGDGWFPDHPGGLNRYFRSLLESLSATGLDVEGVVLGPASDAPPSIRVPAESSASVFRRIVETARVAPADIDLADVHFALYGLIPTLFGPARRVPRVVHFHGPWADESLAAGAGSPVASWLKRGVERAVYGRASELVTLSGAFKRLLVERYGVSPWRVTVIPPGVDLTRYAVADRAAARFRWGIAEDTWMAVAVRRLVPRMGLDILLDSWADARPTGGLLVIAGEGQEGDLLRDRAARLGLGESVRFAGGVDERDLPSLYQAADVSVVPSRGLEGFGLIVLESLACGTPVITSDSGGLPEVTAGLQPSLVVPAEDISALSGKLSSTRAGNLPSREECRKHAESFDWSRAVTQHIVVYRRALSPGKSRKLRVVYLGHTARLSGGELALLRLLPALTREVEAHVILAEEGPLVGRLIEAGISVEVLTMNEHVRGARRDSLGAMSLPASAAYTVKLAARLRYLRPDLVHANSLKACLYGTAAARLARVPSIWHARDRVADDYLPGVAVRLVRAAARTLPSSVIANSRATLETLPGVRRPFVVPSPIDIPARVEHPNGRPLRIGMVGRIAPWKGQHVFVEAFARAFPDGDQQAVVIGAPLFGEDEVDYLGQVQELGRRLELGDRLIFRGFSNHVSDELETLDVLVHASVKPEPFGQVILEGMASGLAVVAAAAGGPLELIEDGRDGLLVRPGDAEALADALRRLERDPMLRDRLGQAGREKASAYTSEAVARTMIGVYLETLSPR